MGLISPSSPAIADKVREVYDWLDEDDKRALGKLVRADSRVTDPLARLFDPSFTATTWPYEFSQTDPEIPGSLHKKQVEALNADARQRWLFWGNQVGKTTVGAIDVVSACLGRHPVLNKLWQPPLTCWASALSWELWEKILLPELLTWIPRDRLIDAPAAHNHSTKRDVLIRADNGRISRITGKAAEQGADKYQSARVHLVWLDEEHPEAIWDEMQPRLLRHGGRTIATITPLKGLTWLHSRIYEPWKSGRSNRSTVFISHAGLKDNPSIKLEEIEALTNELKHNPAQLEARLYGHFVRPSGLVLPFDADKHVRDFGDEEIEKLIVRGQPVAGIDFGLWRFAFVLAVPDADGRLVIIDEIFSQRESLEDRAQKVHNLLTKRRIASVGTRRFWIWGDCANPQDILEINQAFARIKSPYRVVGVQAENKLIKVGVERIENLMNRGAFVVRRGIGSGQTWNLGMNAARQGVPIEGSRWLWEVNNWQYPRTEEGKIQKDNPDDASADGADAMAATRYLVMSWWKAGEREPERRVHAEDMSKVAARIDKKFKSGRELELAGETRYTPSFGGEDGQGEPWRTPRFGGSQNGEE